MNIIDKIIKNRVKILWCSCFISILVLTLMKIDDDGTPSFFDAIPHFDKIAHFIMFFSLSILGSFYIIKTHSNRLRWQIANFICVVALSGLIEIIQPYFGRECSLYDFYANLVGALTGSLLAKWAYYNIIKKIFK